MATEKKTKKTQLPAQTSTDNNEQVNPIPSPGTDVPKDEANGENPPLKKASKAKKKKEIMVPEADAQADDVKSAGKTAKKTAAKKIKEDISASTKTNPAKKAAKEPKPKKLAAKKDTADKENATTPAEDQQPAQQENPLEIPPVPAPVSQLKKIIFQLKYHTKVGENIFVVGDHLLLGNDNTDNAFALQYLNEDYWFGELEIDESHGFLTSFSYKYFVKNEYGITDMELVCDKYFDATRYNVAEVRLIDSWSFAGYFENTFLTEPFKQVLLKDNYNPGQTTQPATYSHIFKVKAPLLGKNQAVAIFGSCAEFGKWDTSSPVLLSRQPADDYWMLAIDLSSASYPITYKYGIVDTSTQQFVQLEGDKNRVVFDGAGPDKLTIISDGFAVFANNTFKGAGVAIPVFSLRSNQSFGVGEFNDMKLLVDWAKMIGLKLVQILPVNDTTATHTWVDSYPYAAISALALHPMFLHLPAVVSNENAHLLNDLEAVKSELNQLDKVDYERTVTTKLEFLKKLFPLQKQETFSRKDFTGFFDENSHWLVPYAMFSYLRDEYGTPDFTTWPQHSTYTPANVQEFASDPRQVKDEIAIHFFTQFHLHLQLKAATEYAHSNGIIVKGDIPIGIYRNSADAWQEPELYNMDMQAGAPPDDFAVKGQNWGFPTYNWHRMQQNGFEWWKRRFAQMSYYFDAFRIDHILGFFRIWSIPMHAVEGIMGTFVPAVPLYKNELENNGIHIDTARLTIPYINENILWQEFGDLAPQVKHQFLYENGYEHYALKSEFDTQRKVLEHFKSLPASEENDRLKNGLFNLISNVVLFDVAESHGQQFHFRIAMEDTASFRFLDGDTQYKLKELYVNYFFRRQDEYWRQEAMHKLPELKRSTNMLICGEDLGMVPDCVPGVMKQLGILSLEIQRMPKDPAREFFHPNDAPYLSVVTPSTHDMSTIRSWWEEDPAKTRRFYHYQLGKWGDAPFFCEPDIAQAIIVQHLYSPAMWSIFQLQDLMAIDGSLRRNNPADERINVPANPQHYWQYRMHLTLEDLMQQTAFNNTLKELVAASGR